MSLAFRNEVIRFDPTKGRKQREPGSATFNSNIINSSVALRGFHIGYTNGDHHIYQLQIDIDKGSVIGPTQKFNVDFLLRDSSGGIDDRYEGWVEVLVIAEVE